MPREQKPMQSFGYGHLLEPELKKFRNKWQGNNPAPFEKDEYLMLIAWWPECVDAGERGEEARIASKKLRELYPDCYKDQPIPTDYAAAVHFAATYAEFPDFVAGWLNHARQFLTDVSAESIARRWLLTTLRAKKPKYDGSGKRRKILADGGEMVAVSKLQLQEICDVIERDTGKQISVATLRRVRDETIGEAKAFRELAKEFHIWLKARPEMQEISLTDAENAFMSEMKEQFGKSNL